MLIGAIVSMCLAGGVAIDPLIHVGTITADLRGPSRIAVAADESFVVADALNNHLARFDAAGASLGAWAVPEGPVGVAVHPDGRYFVTHRDDALVAIHDATFAFVGFLGDGVVTFQRPTDIDVASDTGRVYVVDSGADRIYAFESDGSLALLMGERGTLPGQFKYPSAIAVDEAGGRIVVADHDNFRVQTFTTTGVFLTKFGYRILFLPGGLDEGWMPRTLGLSVDGAGRIYVSDGMMSTVRVFDPVGVELGKVVTYGYAAGEVRVPCDLALSVDETRVYVVSTNASSVEIYEAPVLGAPLEGSSPALGVNLSAEDRFMSAGGWPPTESPASDYEGPHMIEEPVICGRCHGITGQPGGHLGLVEGQTALCTSCHNTAGQGLSIPINETDLADPFGTHPTAIDGQGRSHAWGVDAVNVFADSVGPAPGGEMEAHLDGGSIKCATCHNQHNNNAGAPYLRVSNAGDAMCKECHAPRDCGVGACGSHPVGFLFPGGTGEFPVGSTPGLPPLKAGNVECTTCHAPHGADSGAANGGAGDGMLLRSANDETMCQLCHTEHVIHTPSGGWQPTCNECHDVHDPDNVNLSLVATSVHNQTTGLDAPVVFLAREGPNSFDDGDPTANDGICQVCHTATTYHLASGLGIPHNDGLACTDCHPHSAGFMPTGGDCTSCHAAQQGPRRPVVGEFAMASHHIQGADVTASDCIVCHDTSQHQQGRVRLWNVDAPGNLATVIELTGDPMTDSVEAVKLETFCLACHDADAASGSVPFADGMTPPVIDAAAWSAASHHAGGAAGPMTCFGGGEAFGCHSTGHGSAKLDMLAPFDASQPAVPGDPLREEEGMCYTCHDADGPASSDVQSLFALAHHHNVSSLEQVDGSRVECSDCHNPHSASPSALLANPDSGAPWAGDGVSFCQTCHDGNPPAGVSFPAGSTGTGYDKSAFGGTTHASLLGPDSCRSCHEDHGSSFGSLLKDQYIIADYNPYTPGDGDYAACWACHDETATIFQLNAFRNRHDKHVRSEDAPCFICHDTHAPFDMGEEGLINFQTSFDNGYDIQFIDGEDASTAFWIDPDQANGNCYIRCHSRNHTPESYERIDASTVDCTGCHAAAQNNGDGLPVGGRRAVVSEFPAADAHAHYGAQLDNTTCLVCHSIGTHSDGFVELIDPDDGSVYRFVQPEDLAFDPDVSNFCQGCHDADGATRLGMPLDPFGSGNVPPDTATLFTGTLQWEEMYGDGCFADEGTLRPVNSHHDISDGDQAFSGAKLECLNCHGAHTSSASQPVSDPFDTTSPWVGASNDFCFQCHGGGTGPLDPAFPPGVVGPVIDVSDPRWVDLGMDWTTILGGACLTADCSSLRGVESCENVEGPWYVDYTWTHSAHGPDSKRAWNGYSGAPSADMDCQVCHDPHGSYTPVNPAGNPYMIRDFVDGTTIVDDGTRTGGWNGPPWNTFGSARVVEVGVAGLTVGWGDPGGLCAVCHADWLAAYDFHGFCDGCMTCHAHGAAFGEADFVGGDDDTPCPVPPAPLLESPWVELGDEVVFERFQPLHRADPNRVAPVEAGAGRKGGGGRNAAGVRR